MKATETQTNSPREFTPIEKEIIKEIQRFICLTSKEVVIAAAIGSWKSTQTDSQLLKILKEVNGNIQSQG